MPTRFVFLASRSPRRSALLRQIGVAHEVVAPDPASGWPAVDETPGHGEAPDAYVRRIAHAKADEGWTRLSSQGVPPHPVLAADTTVALDGQILGKPDSEAAAKAMIGALSGRTHDVFTAVAVASRAGIAMALSRSAVTMRSIAEDEIDRYIAIGESMDKAGAYAVQGHAAMFISKIDGSYTGVMGLPLFETANLLIEAGLVLP